MLKSIKFSNDLLNLLLIRSLFPLGALHLCRLHSGKKRSQAFAPYLSVLWSYLQHAAAYG